MKIYLASPLGFAESTRGFLRDLVRTLEADGLECFNPWDRPEGQIILEAEALPFGTKRIDSLRRANRIVAAANESGIDESDLVLAVLDGPDVDSGTASEIGYAYARGKRILGLRTDFRRTGDNDAALVNLQVQYWIESSGGTICRSLRELTDILATELPLAAMR